MSEANGVTQTDVPAVEESSGGGDRGILCNDPSGLNLAFSGGITRTETAKAGIYTNLARLASQLSHHNEDAAPLITLETETAAWLVKEYDGGHAVVLLVPSQSTSEANGTSAAAEDNAKA